MPFIEAQQNEALLLSLSVMAYHDTGQLRTHVSYHQRPRKTIHNPYSTPPPPLLSPFDQASRSPAARKGGRGGTPATQRQRPDPPSVFQSRYITEIYCYGDQGKIHLRRSTADIYDYGDLLWISTKEIHCTDLLRRSACGDLRGGPFASAHDACHGALEQVVPPWCPPIPPSCCSSS